MKGPNFAFKHEVSAVDTKAHYMTEAKDKFVNAKIPPKNTEAGSLLTYCRQAHFSVGSQGQSLVSSKQLYYAAPQQGSEPAKLNSALLKDLKKEHYVLGDSKGEHKTTYRGQFKWIQPFTGSIENPETNA